MKLKLFEILVTEIHIRKCTEYSIFKIALEMGMVGSKKKTSSICAGHQFRLAVTAVICLSENGVGVVRLSFHLMDKGNLTQY